jgi:hypothetical protein
MLAKKIGGAGRGMHKQGPSAATAPTLQNNKRRKLKERKRRKPRTENKQRKGQGRKEGRTREMHKAAIGKRGDFANAP